MRIIDIYILYEFQEYDVLLRFRSSSVGTGGCFSCIQYVDTVCSVYDQQPDLFFYPCSISTVEIFLMKNNIRGSDS